jgi:hypothetical protein
MDEARVRKLADGRIYSGAPSQGSRLGRSVGHSRKMPSSWPPSVPHIATEPAVYYSRPEQERWWERMFMGVFGRRLPGSAARLVALRVVAVIITVVSQNARWPGSKKLLSWCEEMT